MKNYGRYTSCGLISIGLCIAAFYIIPLTSSAQSNPPHPYLKPLSLSDTSWTSLEGLSSRQIHSMVISKSLDFRDDRSGQIQVRAKQVDKLLYHLEVYSDKEHKAYLFVRHHSTATTKDTSVAGGNCQLAFEKFTDRKLYVKASQIPDELYAFWNHRLVPFRRNGKTITIHLPEYVDSAAFSHVSLYGSWKAALTNEIIIPLQNGKPVDMSETFSGFPWDGIQRIEYKSVENIQLKSETIAPNINVEIVEEAKPSTSVELKKEESTESVLPSWIGVYADVYYALYNDSLGTSAFQKFQNTAPRSNAFGLNTIQINLKYSGERIRAFATLHYGDYAKTAWTAEYNNIMEAYAGFRLAKSLWMDAGFFRSYLGSEGLLPCENICSFVSAITFFSPAQYSGIRLQYMPTERWTIQLALMNIYHGFVDNNEEKSAGIYVNYSLGDRGSIAYTNYLGDDTPGEDSNRVSHLRFHQNASFNYAIGNWQLQLGADLCLMKHSDLQNPNVSASMFSFLATTKYRFTQKWAAYGRLEYFHDPNSIMSTAFTDHKNNLTGYKLWGLTAGMELRPVDNIFFRLEGRRLQLDADQKIFYRNSTLHEDRLEFQLNAGVEF